jgi:Papain family cysteine protease
MKKILKNLLYLLIPLTILSISFSSCDPEEVDEWLTVLDDVLGEDGDYSVLFGWAEDEEDLESVEDDINLGVEFGSGDLPTSVDLTPYFPPIGNQGSYGTCVAWAVGYNMKTFLEAYDGDYSPNSSSQQFSPKYLFWSIPDAQKGEDCNGTSFEPALDVILESGIATLSDAPYDGLGDCSYGQESGWSSSAANHKISNYREISVDIETIKSYLADNRAVAFGAKLGDEFMEWDDDGIIDYDTYGYVGQHAYHAMSLSGYDDSKNAFRVVNSWSNAWGDDGYIWVDYDFFVESFCFAAFVATNVQSNPDGDGDGDVDDVTTGNDLVAWNLNDEDYYNENDPYNDRDRMITYNVYNSGSQTIYASQDWNILYVYYNAYDAEDYGIMVFDYYTDDFGDNERHYDLIPSDSEFAYGQTNWWNNIDIPSGESVAETLIPGIDNFNFGYEVPSNLTGYYYFVLMADGFDDLQEVDETNNNYYFSQENGDPIYVENGIIYNGKKNGRIASEKPQQFDKSPSPTPVDENHLNTYTPEEISKMLTAHKKSGKLSKKAAEFISHKKQNRSKRN